MKTCFSPYIAAVCLSLAIGAGPARAEKLRVAYAYESSYFHKVLDAFAREHDVELITANIEDRAFKVQLLEKARNRQLPHAIIVPSDFLGLKSLDFSPVPEDWFDADIDPASIALTRVDGAARAIPITAGNHLLLYYNRQHVENPVRSWRELARSDSGNEGKLIAWNFNEMYWFSAFVNSFGVEVWSDGKLGLDSMAMDKALEFYWQLKHQGILDTDCAYDCSIEQFESGALHYTINGIWTYARFRDALGASLGVARLPQIEGRNMRPFFSAQVLAFPNRALASTQRDTLEQLARYMQRVPVQRDLWDRIRVLPSNKLVRVEIQANADANTTEILRQLEDSVPLPSSYEMAIIWEAMAKGFARFGGGVYDARTASEYMQHIAAKSIANSDAGDLPP